MILRCAVMSVPELTGRERVNRALERRDHDRIPRWDHPWPETLERWRGEGFEGDDEPERDQ